MTGTHTQNPIYSRITMALMEDTGWYLPNYDLAEDLKWGKVLSSFLGHMSSVLCLTCSLQGLGCDFAMKSCKEWMELRSRKGLSIHPYCNKVFIAYTLTATRYLKTISLLQQGIDIIFPYCNNVSTAYIYIYASTRPTV